MYRRETKKTKIVLSISNSSSSYNAKKPYLPFSTPISWSLYFPRQETHPQGWTADGEQEYSPRNKDKTQDALISLDRETYTGRSHVNFITQLPISPSSSYCTGSIEWSKPLEPMSEKKTVANFIHGLPPNFKSVTATAHLPVNIQLQISQQKFNFKSIPLQKLIFRTTSQKPK